MFYCVAQTKRCMPCSLAISLETRPIKILVGVVSRLAIQLRSRDAHPRDPSHMLCLAFACARSPIATIKSIVQRISFIHLFMQVLSRRRWGREYVEGSRRSSRLLPRSSYVEVAQLKSSPLMTIKLIVVSVIQILNIPK